MILVLTLRQIGRVLSKTLAIDSWLVVRDGPRSLMYITEGSAAILQRAGLASAVEEEATPWFGSPDVEYCLTNCSTPFFGAAVTHAVTRS